MKYYANLHTHSTHSDGRYSPSELARMAKIEGYGAVAVTDHDVVTGYPELRDECEKLGLECILGAEFSSPSKLLAGKTQMAGEFHILGFGFDPEYPEMKEYLAGMSLRESEQTRILFERGVKIGFLKDITWDEVLEFNHGITWLCNEHVWRLLLAKGMFKKSDYRTYFNELFGVHRYEIPPCYDFKQEHEIIKLIRDAGGIALLAHPHEQLCHMDALIEMGIQGLEVSHFIMTEEEQKEALKLAYDKGLYIAGGTDHEGYMSGAYEQYEKPEDCPVYAPFASIGTTKEHFDEIKNRRIDR